MVKGIDIARLIEHIHLRDKDADILVLGKTIPTNYSSNAKYVIYDKDTPISVLDAVAGPLLDKGAALYFVM